MELFILIVIGLFGLCIGSFLNVCIYRIPKHENFIVERSHCMNCGYTLAWYDLIPLFSYLFLGGKCRKCKQKISIQYPLVELINALLWVLVFCIKGICIQSIVDCFFVSVLICISVIDFRTYEIPVGFNIAILVLGLITTALDYQNWLEHVIGFFCVSVFLYIIVWLSKGRAMGGGDVKLMAVAGMFLGWKGIVLSLVIGCILGAVIHSIRMRVSAEGHMLAMGPYLSVGILIALLFTEPIFRAYLSLMGL